MNLFNKKKGNNPTPLAAAGISSVDTDTSTPSLTLDDEKEQIIINANRLINIIKNTENVDTDISNYSNSLKGLVDTYLKLRKALDEKIKENEKKRENIKHLLKVSKNEGKTESQRNEYEEKSRKLYSQYKKINTVYIEPNKKKLLNFKNKIGEESKSLLIKFKDYRKQKQGAGRKFRKKRSYSTRKKHKKKSKRKMKKKSKRKMKRK